MKITQTLKNQVNPGVFWFLVPFGALCAVLVIMLNIKLIWHNSLGLNLASANGRFWAYLTNMELGACAFSVCFLMPFAASLKDKTVRSLISGILLFSLFATMFVMAPIFSLVAALDR